jgi:hypothetical protein
MILIQKTTTLQPKVKSKKCAENTIKTATGSPDRIASPASSMISVA